MASDTNLPRGIDSLGQAEDEIPIVVPQSQTYSLRDSNPAAVVLGRLRAGPGQVAERLIAAVLKTANPQGFVGSNPTLSGVPIVFHL